MATTNSLHHHSSYQHHDHFNLHRRHHQSLFSPSSISLKNTSSTATLSLTCSSSSTSSTALSAATASNAAVTESVTKFDVLTTHLINQDFRQADEETRRLLIQLAGESAVKRGYVFFSEVKFISIEDLQTLDNLWIQHSDGRFGYSVQRKIWGKVKKDFTRFFIKVGWMKKLDTEVLQYNYRAFPDEFQWELNDETPQGHLPLTNALRGTQLLKCVLSHPAFASTDADNNEEEDEDVVNREQNRGGKPKQDTEDKRVFKTDYSF